MPRHTNDGSASAPSLKVYLNLDNLTDLRPGSLWPGLAGRAQLEKLAADGFEGAQRTEDTPPPADSPIPFCGLGRVNTPSEADPLAAKHAARGYSCITIHAGWGIEDDSAVDRLVEAILAASETRRLPIFLETHRATITQDMWRTVRIANKFPEIRFNGDFSHFYTGQEMVYGGVETKLDFMQPIFDRVGFIHGRVSSPGCMQVPVDNGVGRPRQAHGTVDYLEHFRQMWTRAMSGFLRSASNGDYMIFAPELLSGTYYYARLFPDAQGALVEESDRYKEALVYQRIARECFAAAQLCHDARR
jgi:hypothetical protein